MRLRTGSLGGAGTHHTFGCLPHDPDHLLKWALSFGSTSAPIVFSPST